MSKHEQALRHFVARNLCSRRSAAGRIAQVPDIVSVVEVSRRMSGTGQTPLVVPFRL